MHSEMGPVWQNPIQRTVRTAYDRAQLQYNTTQNSSDNLPSYLLTTIIAQMLTTRGEGSKKQRDMEIIQLATTAIASQRQVCHFSRN